MPVQLLHSPAEIVATALLLEGTGTSPLMDNEDWQIHYSDEPDLPDNVITVYDTTGKADGSSMHDGYVWEHQGIMVRIRASTHRIGWRKADEVRETLARGIYYETITLNASTYKLVCVGDVGSIVPNGKEAPNSARRVFSINCTVAIRAVS